MASSSASLTLADGSDATGWMASVLAGWGLPAGLARSWSPALSPALAGAAELVLEHDAGLGLVSVEVRDAGGRVVTGLDDFVGTLGAGV